MMRRSFLISSIGAQPHLTNHRCTVFLDRSLVPSPSLMLPSHHFQVFKSTFPPQEKSLHLNFLPQLPFQPTTGDVRSERFAPKHAIVKGELKWDGLLFLHTGCRESAVCAALFTNEEIRIGWAGDRRLWGLRQCELRGRHGAGIECGFFGALVTLEVAWC
jgi:hypothetical protein